MRQRKEGKLVPCIPTRLSVLCEGSPEKSDRSQMTALSSSTVARDEGIQRTEEWDGVWSQEPLQQQLPLFVKP